ncbi:MAG TPA: PNGase F N-terminal domain-containing protein, partial [Draconibacterium sp.]|nr:PNGase F N-terminal domain-containing protein [Draconibacterium sp.]
MFKIIKVIGVLIALLVFDSGSSATQKSTTKVKVVYKWVINGEERGRGGKNTLIATPEFSQSFTDNTGINLIPETPKEVSYIDYLLKKTYQVADLSDGSKVYTDSEFSEYPEIVETDEIEKILDYNCKKVKTLLRSNNIEIWYTTEIEAKGTPIMSYGIPDGLVLKVVRNGSSALVASEIEFLDENASSKIIPENLGKKVDMPLYRYKLTNSFITTISVFNDEQISWGNSIENPAGEQTDKTYRFAGGTIVVKKVRLPQVTPETQIFAELTQYSNGDAYDRTGTVFMIPVEKEKSFLDALQNGIKTIPAFSAANGKEYFGTISTPDFSPAVELVRFFTPFGINHFNESVEVYGQQWEKNVYYKQEITELLPLLQNEVWIGVFIGNYDKGGHKVSLDLKYYPGSQYVREKKEDKQSWIYPLFNTLNIMEMAGQEYGTMFENDSLEIEFEVPNGVNNMYLRYISTGHGGWGGGDEFNKKMNSIIIDGELIHSYIPWNCNCGVQRKYNPASGNFWNGLSSSDYSRSGWCPGEATNPVYIPINNLEPGKHKLKVAIPLGKS